MKTYLLLISVVIFSFNSCKKEAEDSTGYKNQGELSQPTETLSGEFIYSDSLAVFNTNDEIYGVVMNTKAKEMIKKAKSVSSNPYASFDVVLEGIIKDNEEENAWPQVIEIQNILNMKPSTDDSGLRLN